MDSGSLSLLERCKSSPGALSTSFVRAFLGEAFTFNLVPDNFLQKSMVSFALSDSLLSCETRLFFFYNKKIKEKSEILFLKWIWKGNEWYPLALRGLAIL